MTFIVLIGGLKEASQDSPALASCWNGVRDALIFPLGPANLGGTSSSCNPRWYALVLGGIGNTSSGCASWDLLPSYSAV